MIRLEFDNIDITTKELIKEGDTWTEVDDVMYTGDTSRPPAIFEQISYDLDRIEVSSYALGRMIRLARDTGNHLVLVNRAKTHVLIIDHKHLRTLKYCRLLKEVIAQEKAQLDLYKQHEKKQEANKEKAQSLHDEIARLEEKKQQLEQEVLDLEAVISYQQEVKNGTLETVTHEEVLKEVFNED